MIVDSLFLVVLHYLVCLRRVGYGHLLVALVFMSECVIFGVKNPEPYQ
jgi:hypothetical protein